MAKSGISMTTLLIIGAGAFGVYEYAKPGHGMLGGIMGNISATTAGATPAAAAPPVTTTPTAATVPTLGDHSSYTPPTPPPSGMTYEQACAEARTQLIAIGWPSSSSTSCAQISNMITADKTLFVAPSTIRTAMGG
jgi:hypothetical protein